MNERQKRTLQAILAVLVLMFLFPPFHEPLGSGVMGNSGFSFILMPPESDSYITPSINSLQLIAQWFGVVVIGAVAYFLEQGQDSTPKVTSTNWSAVLVEAFQRSKMWLWVGLAFIVMPVFWANDSHAFAIKLIGNTGAALLIYAIAFSWQAVRVLRGLPAASEKPPVRTSIKRILYATTLGAIGIGVLILVTSKSKGYEPWERGVSSTGRDLFKEAGIAPPHNGNGQAPSTQGSVNWDDFTPVHNGNGQAPSAQEGNKPWEKEWQVKPETKPEVGE